MVVCPEIACVLEAPHGRGIEVTTTSNSYKNGGEKGLWGFVIVAHMDSHWKPKVFGEPGCTDKNRRNIIWLPITSANLSWFRDPQRSQRFFLTFRFHAKQLPKFLCLQEGTQLEVVEERKLGVRVAQIKKPDHSRF